MSDFVEECRREWKRLRVPGPSADEMADDLSADLQEAEQEGAFPEEVLGDAAKDPRAFAEAWARERGLVQPRYTDRLRVRTPILVALVVFGLLVVIAIVAAALLLARSTSGAARTRTAVTSQVVTVRQLFSGIVGTSIGRVSLTPGPVNLVAGGGKPRVIEHAPTALTATVRNSGDAKLAKVTVVVLIDGHTYQRTLVNLPRGSVRRLRFALPAQLPSSFTINVRTLPVRGERNLSNNSATWRLRVRG